MSSILSISNLDKTFGTRRVLHGFSLEVSTGSSLAITGASGCGKSTLLNIIGLLEAPSGGSITIAGTPYPRINSSRAAKIRRTLISYLFQSYALIQSQSALENVLLGMKYVPGKRKEKIGQAQDLLSRLGLAQVMNDKIFTLSGGEQQRVALARCILKPGNLILADEPTGALDPSLADVVLHEILHLQHEYGKSLIIVTHNHKVAESCDRQIALKTSA